MAGSATVRLHRLSTRREGDRWIVGRVETGDFVAVPGAAVRVIGLLAEGRRIDEVRASLRAETDRDFDVAGFVTSLLGLGFVEAVSGKAVDQERPPPATLSQIRPDHVRWLLHPAVMVGVGLVVIAAAIVSLGNPALLPGYHDLVWSRAGSAVLLGNAALGWTLVLLHELGHLLAARAAGVPGRMSLGTRLQFLAAQTDVSGVWAAPRRIRLTVYLAGIAVNLLVAAVGVLAEAGGLAPHVMALVVLTSLLFIPPQFLIFMRTDLYFVLQDVTGCRNLYADGSAYLRHLARRRWRGGGDNDPSARLPARERRAVRAYSVLLLVGTAGCLAIALVITLPALLSLLGSALTALIVGAPAGTTTDAALVVVVIGGMQALWFRAWWRRHGSRVRRFTERRFTGRR